MAWHQGQDMPAPRNLTRTDRELYESQLAYYAERGIHQIRAEDFGVVTGYLRELGLDSYEGYPISYLARLWTYLGETTFRRGLTATLTDSDWNTRRVGEGRLPATPTKVTFIAQLESENHRLKLVAQFSRQAEDYTLQNLITRNALHANLSRAGSSADARVTTYRRIGNLPSLRYAERVLPGSSDQVRDAFERAGLEGIWRLLDNMWADFLAGRQPKSKPLSLVGIRIRCGVHAGRTVKVSTTAGELFGTVDFVESEKVLVVHEPDGTPRSIPTREVREIVPYRL